MQWDIVDFSYFSGLSVLTKVGFYFFIIATIVLIKFIVVNIQDSRKMKRQLSLWLESGEQPLQLTFISAGEWAGMLPINWANLPAWERLFNFWIRPKFDLSRKAKGWAILSILVGLCSSVFELIKAFRDIGILGVSHIEGISVRISEALVPFFFAVVVGLFFYLLAFFANAQIGHWQKRMIDAIKKPIEAKASAAK